ncbi:hypothetical protein PG991_013445 [Apiospora marii]|uniref:Major facilitator superfamily (MFS) profile domain-containing protein n=1 Tax=Apiospora marii TaxID=335849 RepID=A0ABR1R649_9PEZI
MTSVQADEAPKRGWRFWAIFSGLCLSALLSALEGAIVSTALPTMSSELQSGANYVWVINVYFLTCAIVQPLCGQLADLWGRRWIMLGSVLLFMAASAICGAAQDTATLIVGRAVQGLGGGGINMLVDVIICDLVPLVDRGSIIGLLFALISMISSFGPLIGGALTSAGQWRWIFYLNLPLGAVALAILFASLKVSHRGGLGWKQRVRRIDLVGNFILRSPWCVFPVAPRILFSNQTSVAAFFITFNHGMLIYWATYFFPLYFQSVRGASPEQSGLNLLVLAFIFPFFTAVCGGILAKTSEYKILHIAGLGVTAIGFSVCSLLDQLSSTGMWVGLQLLVAAGLGIAMPALLPAVQAELSDEESASSTGTWAFVRSLGSIWGVTVPAAVFSNRAFQLADTVQGHFAREALMGGHAYEHGTAAFLDLFSGDTREQIVNVFADSLRLSWWVGIAFAGVSLMAALFERRVKLRQNLESDFGLQQGRQEANMEISQGAGAHAREE